MLTPHSFWISMGIYARAIVARAWGRGRENTRMYGIASGMMTGAGLGVAVN